MSGMKTTMSVRVLGGRFDGRHWKIAVPTGDEGTESVRVEGEVYRVYRQAGITFIVHETAQRLIWPDPQ